MEHLYSHKPRQTVLRPKVEALLDNDPYKPKCLYALSRLFQRVGNQAERKQLLVRTLELERQRGDDLQVAQMLTLLSDANLILGLREEGMRQAREALEIYERIDNTIGQRSVYMNSLGCFSAMSNSRLQRTPQPARSASFRRKNTAQGADHRCCGCPIPEHVSLTLLNSLPRPL